MENNAEVAASSVTQPTVPRFTVVTGEVEHPLKPGIVGYLARWPTGMYTLVVGHTHYTIPQEWAAAQVALTPEVAHE